MALDSELAVFGVGFAGEPTESLDLVDGERHPAAAAPEQVTESRGRAAVIG